MGLSYGLVNLMYSMLYGEHWKIKGSRSKKRGKLLTCFANSLFKVTSIFSEGRPDLRYITWELIQDPFYKEPKGMIDISEVYTAWIICRMI